MSNLSLMRLAVGSVMVIVCQSHPAQAQAFDAGERCRAITGLHRAAVEIVSAKLVDAAPPGTVRDDDNTQNTIPVALSAHCRIEGVINRRKGAGGVEARALLLWGMQDRALDRRLIREITPNARLMPPIVLLLVVNSQCRT